MMTDKQAESPTHLCLNRMKTSRISECSIPHSRINFFIMKFQTVFLGHLLLQAAQASSIPKDVFASLKPRDDLKTSNSSKIDWSECDLDFGDNSTNRQQKDYDCARLSVPLDYTSASNGETIKLDLIKAKATKEPYLGSVLYNPGGPGGSGVEAIVWSGKELAE